MEYARKLKHKQMNNYTQTHSTFLKLSEMENDNETKAHLNQVSQVNMQITDNIKESITGFNEKLLEPLEQHIYWLRSVIELFERRKALFVDYQTKKALSLQKVDVKLNAEVSKFEGEMKKSELGIRMESEMIK